MTKQKKTKEKEKAPEVKAPKQPTLKEKVSSVVDDNFENKDALKKGVFNLIQRILYPDQFCPDCDDRLFLEGQTYKCLNCGHSHQAAAPAPTPMSAVGNTPAPVAKTGKVPKQVEEAIAQAQDNMSDTPRSTVATEKGAAIRKLAEQVGDSSVPPTKEDEEILKGSDPVVKDVNWV